MSCRELYASPAPLSTQKSKAPIKIISIAVLLLLIAVGAAFYLITKNNSTAPGLHTAETSKKSAPSSKTKPMPTLL